MPIDTAALRSSVDIVAVVGSRIPLIRQGHEFKALCPFHEDVSPSLFIIPDKMFCHCFGCDWSGDAIEFLREFDGIDFKSACQELCRTDWKALPMSSVVPKRVTPRQNWQSEQPPLHYDKPETFDTQHLGPAVAVWTYRNARGEVLGYVARYHVTSNGITEKRTPTWSYGKTDGASHWAMRRWSRPYPLYGLDRIAAKSTNKIIIVEGEKTADAAQQLFPLSTAITWCGGAQAVQYADWSPVYGRSVVVIPDADAQGRVAAKYVMELLSNHGCRVQWVDPEPTRPKGWDLADALADNWTNVVAFRWGRENMREYSATPSTEPSPSETPVIPEASSMPNAPPLTEPSPSETPVIPEASSMPNAIIATGGAISEEVDAPMASPQKTRKQGIIQLVGDDEPPLEENPALPPAFSDDAIAAHVVYLHGNDWRYITDKNEWYRWTGNFWERDEKNQIFSVIRFVCRDMIDWRMDTDLTDTFKRSITSSRTHAAVHRVVSYDEQISTKSSIWDANPWILATPGGLIDLQTNELRPARREDYQTQCTAVSADENGCPMWLAFLDRVTNHDVELQNYLQRLAGYSLTGVTTEQMLAFFYGTGANGKSVFLKTLRNVLGSYACSASMDIFSEVRNEPHPTVYARLDRKRCVVAAETEEGRRWAESKIKQLTGGEPMQARRMRQDEYEFTPMFKLIFAGNHKPSLRTVDEAMRRRVHIVPWVVTIPQQERDHQLDAKLQKEYGGILKWMIDGCAAWQREGLNAPPCVREATDEYLETEDALKEWLEENCILSPSEETPVATIYRDYLSYCEALKEHPWSKKRLIADLQTRGVDRTRLMGIRCWRGIGLKNTEQMRQW